VADEEPAAFPALADPRRRGLFDVVTRAGRAVTRDEVVAMTGVDRALVAHHLDRLADAGLLQVSFARPPGRPAGPGAGRPTKHYAAAVPEVLLAVPPRRYELAARILARALLAGGDAVAGVPRAAEDEGRRLGAEHATGGGGRDAVSTLFTDLGYAPRPVEDGLRLANCPFHALLDVSVDLICGANQALCTGLLDGVGAGDVRAVLDPEPGPECCVRLATGSPGV
jgi:predicted ArsR family transcriptional regulator